MAESIDEYVKRCPTVVCEYEERCPTLSTLRELLKRENELMVAFSNMGVGNAKECMRRGFCYDKEMRIECPTYGFIRWEATNYQAMEFNALKKAYDERIEDLKKLGLFENNSILNFSVKDDERATLITRLINFDGQITSVLTSRRLENR
jgi:hypothetical protein